MLLSCFVERLLYLAEFGHGLLLLTLRNKLLESFYRVGDLLLARQVKCALAEAGAVGFSS